MSNTENKQKRVSVGKDIATRRRVARARRHFRIRKNRKAHMTLLNVDAPPAAINEVERQQRLSEDVLRFMTVRVEELEEGPSAMMRKADRDERERGERGDRGSRGPRRERDGRSRDDDAVVEETEKVEE